MHVNFMSNTLPTFSSYLHGVVKYKTTFLCLWIRQSEKPRLVMLSVFPISNQPQRK